MLATLRQRNFLLVWLAGLISLTGDWMLSVALPIYVFVLTKSILLTGVMVIAGLAPNLLFGSLAGVFVDRWNRKWTMVIASALQAGTLVPLLFVTSADRVWLVYVAAFAEATLGLFFKPAQSALLPLLVDERHLVAANSLSGVNSNLSRLIGPALGGIVVAVLGLPGVIWSDLASFTVAALLISLVSGKAANREARPAEKPAAGTPSVKRSMWRELGEGIHIVLHTRAIAVVFVMLAVTGVGEGLFSTLLVVWVVRILHGGALEMGWLMSGQAVGGLLGGVMIALVGKRVRPSRLLAVCSLLFGAIDVAIVDAPLFAPPYLPPSPAPQFTSSLVLFVVALFIAVGVLAPGIRTGRITLAQTSVDNTYLGRIFALVGVVTAVAGTTGILIASFYGDQLGVIQLLNGQGGLYILSGFIALAFLWRLPAAGKRAATTEVREPATTLA